MYSDFYLLKKKKTYGTKVHDDSNQLLLNNIFLQEVLLLIQLFQTTLRMNNVHNVIYPVFNMHKYKTYLSFLNFIPKMVIADMLGTRWLKQKVKHHTMYLSFRGPRFKSQSDPSIFLPSHYIGTLKTLGTDRL